MATQQIKTRILNKISSWTEWDSVKTTFKPLRGEICIVEIPTGTSGTGLTPPATGMKVGDGEHFFGELPWIQAIAGDVSAWCKENMADYDKFKTQVENVVNTTLGNLDSAIEGLDGRITALETKVGDDSKGLVKDVADLKSLTGEHTTAISNLNSNKVNVSVAEAATATDKLVKESTVDNKITAATNELNQTIGGVAETAQQGVTNAATAQAAAEAAQSAADAAQGSANTNAGEITTIKGNITDINSDISELKEAVGIGESVDGQTLTKRIESLEATIDTAETGLSAVVAGHTTSIGNLNSSVGDHETRLGAAEGKVNKLIGSDTDKSVRDIANLVIAEALTDGGESFDTLQEIAAWLKDHPEDVGEMNEKIGQNAADIAQNTQDIAGLNTTTGNLDSKIDGVQGNLDTVKSQLLGGAELGKDSIATVKAAAKAAHDAADAAQATADQGVTKAGEALTAAGNALTNANAYTDGKIGEVNTAITNINDAIEAMDYSLADGEGLVKTVTQQNGKITEVTRRKIKMTDFDENDVFVFYCGTASELV